MIDIKHTADGDIDFTGDDLSYTESTAQHQRDLLLMDQGHLKESPAAGIGAINFLNDNNPTEFLRLVRQEMVRDGMKIQSVGFTNGELLIQGEYADN